MQRETGYISGVMTASETTTVFSDLFMLLLQWTRTTASPSGALWSLMYRQSTKTRGLRHQVYSPGQRCHQPCQIGILHLYLLYQLWVSAQAHIHAVSKSLRADLGSSECCFILQIAAFKYVSTCISLCVSIANGSKHVKSWFLAWHHACCCLTGCFVGEPIFVPRSHLTLEKEFSQAAAGMGSTGRNGKSTDSTEDDGQVFLSTIQIVGDTPNCLLQCHKTVGWKTSLSVA